MIYITLFFIIVFFMVIVLPAYMRFLGKVMSVDSSGKPDSSLKLADDDLPYTTLENTNGMGFADLEMGSDGVGTKADLTFIDTESQRGNQETMALLKPKKRAAKDVATNVRKLATNNSPVLLAFYLSLLE